MTAGIVSFPHGVKEPIQSFQYRSLPFCIQDPNIEDLIAKIVSYGGKECLFENIIQIKTF
jgi:hypothetical protein